MMIPRPSVRWVAHLPKRFSLGSNSRIASRSPALISEMGTSMVLDIFFLLLSVGGAGAGVDSDFLHV